MTDRDNNAELWLVRGSRRYAPGDTLRGAYRLAAWRDAGLTAVELSVLWHTAGQGEEDYCVHHFERRREPVLPGRSNETPHRFRAVLPASPLSYDGQIVKVCWVVRLRGFLAGGRQRVVEAPFWLGVEPQRVERPAAEGAVG